jgi:fluoride ion exporter CrcB/FEX
LLTEKSLYISALLYAFLTFSLTISAFFIGAKIVSRI